MNPSANSSAPGSDEAETSEGLTNVSADVNDAFRWNVRPSDKEPTKKWGVLVGSLAIFALGMFVFSSVLLGLLGFAIIVASTAEFWLGTSYKLDKDGASVRCGFSYSEMRWNEVKRVMTTPDGLKLSPLGAATRMDSFRGIFLKFGDQSKEQILDFVRRCLPADVGLDG